MQEQVACSVMDAAKRLGVGRTTLYQLIDNGEIRVFKLGSRTLVPQSELVAFVQRKLQGVANG